MRRQHTIRTFMGETHVKLIPLNQSLSLSLVPLKYFLVFSFVARCQHQQRTVQYRTSISTSSRIIEAFLSTLALLKEQERLQHNKELNLQTLN